MDDTTPENGLRRLPLWENTLAKMREVGVGYGSTFSRKWMERQLSCHWNTAEFNKAVIDVRAALERDGFYLSARGQGENGYVILSPAENAVQGATESAVGGQFAQAHCHLALEH